MKYSLYLLLFSMVLVSCKSKKQSAEIQKVNTKYIDSIKRLADTSYTKNQYTSEFALATYYSIAKDSVLMQVMTGKDSAIKQIITTKNNRRIYFAQYYNNGQLKARYEFDGYGSNIGPSDEYYENGRVKEKGIYQSGYRIGDWQVYDSAGNLIETIKYNSNGQPN